MRHSVTAQVFDTATKSWNVAPFNLTRGRESAVAVGLQPPLVQPSLLSIGGWYQQAPKEFRADPALDLFTQPLFNNPSGGLIPGLQLDAADTGCARWQR